MREELARKGIHILGLGYIPAYMLFPRDVFIFILLFGLLFFLVLDIMRLQGYVSYPDILMRDFEYRGLGGHIYFLIGIFIVTILFPSNIALIAVLMLTVGDTVAGITKRMYSHGLLPMLASCVITGILLNNTLDLNLSVMVILAGSVAASLVDAFPIKLKGLYINDNIAIPVGSGLTMYFLSFLRL
jgi:dolichol kinase